MLYAVVDITADGVRSYYIGSDFAYASRTYDGQKNVYGYYHLKLFLIDLHRLEVRLLAEERARIL